MKVIKCNVVHVATDVRGWWINCNATNHNSETKYGLTKFEKKGKKNLHGQHHLS